MSTILVADDHFLVRRGLRQLLESTLDHCTVDEADHGRAVLDMARVKHYDLIILDFSMPGMDGLDLIRDLKDLNPDTHILVLTILPEEQYAVRAFRLGASGCVNKAVNPGELVEAVKTVLAGRRYLSSRAGELLLDDLAGGGAAPHERLSDREFQIFKLLAVGRSVGEIAALLNLSVKTVSTYRTRLMDKMHFENNGQLLHYAHIHGLARFDI